MQSKDCYGQYENLQGKCSGCLRIDATIAADGYFDELAERTRLLEEEELERKERDA